jgi:hypothetical protein
MSLKQWRETALTTIKKFKISDDKVRGDKVGNRFYLPTCFNVKSDTATRKKEICQKSNKPQSYKPCHLKISWKTFSNIAIYTNFKHFEFRILFRQAF